MADASKPVQFPTAFEYNYRFILENILEQMNCRDLPFVDVTLANREIEEYLVSKGYTLINIRYEHKDGEYGFFGRTSGDGHTLKRIIWGQVEILKDVFGDHRALTL